MGPKLIVAMICNKNELQFEYEGNELGRDLNARTFI